MFVERSIIKNRNIELKKSLIKAKTSIKKKFKDLYEQRSSFDERMREQYKPIIKPLQDLIEDKKKKDILQSVTSGTPKLENRENKYLYSSKPPDNNVFKTADKKLYEQHENVTRRLLFPQDQTSPIETKKKKEQKKETVSGDSTSRTNIDSNIRAHRNALPSTEKKHEKQQISMKTDSAAVANPKVKVLSNAIYYSIWKDPESEKSYLGKTEVEWNEGRKMFSVDGVEFPRTSGLTKLLFMQNPSQYTEQDLIVYKQMLMHTHAHRRNFKATNEINRNEKDKKYVELIRHIFPLVPSSEKRKNSNSKTKRSPIGGTLKRKNSLQTNYMIHHKLKRAEYAYWDNPNELVERLKLLISSQKAGHTGHNNEIISIIEELREADIIV